MLPLDDAVQLMTAHAAKGLEFPCVFVVRVASASFPGNYKESLVEFPQAVAQQLGPRPTIPRLCTSRKSAGCFMWR